MSALTSRFQPRPVAGVGRLPRAGWRFHTLLALSGALVLVLCILHLGIGTVSLSPAEVVAALFGHPTLPYTRVIVWELRLPRTLIAAVAGAMLALAGAVLQAGMRNPPAQPEMTGAVP